MSAVLTVYINRALTCFKLIFHFYFFCAFIIIIIITNKINFINNCRDPRRRGLSTLLSTLSTYLPLIDKYQLDEMNDKLFQLTIENVLPKNKKNIAKFLLLFSEQKSL